MAIFRCKMCGGDLEIRPGESVATCEYCGTTQTLPKLDDDRRSNLYDRANHFRRNNEFDKAMGIYEQILNEDGSDAEAYWSLVLCRYGIEYVEDPSSRKRIPTVNRAQYTSIYADENYKAALEHADAYQREIYEAEAKAIDDIQKGILEISSKEEPFDVFICYKETDANGRRTVDSVLATDLYHQLTQEGFKVFFSRITLEDKLGVAYEPYIFAALNSAKVMVALGTKPEYFNAVWVKNEWSRYLALVKQSGGKKTLIPAYRDMDPYDLPEEFSHLQAQDMSKLGFMQDLIRGIKKILAADQPKETVKETVVTSAAQSAVTPLLKRAFIFLEDGDWKSADEYCEKVLDTDPENAQAYLGKLLASIQVRNPDSLSKASQSFANNPNYAKCMRYGDKMLREKLAKDNQTIKDRLEEERLSGLYQKAEELQRRASTEQQYIEASRAFSSISAYRDAAARAKRCRTLAEEAKIQLEEQKREALYDRAKDLAEIASDEKAYRDAAAAFEKVTGFRDADELAKGCLEKAEESRKEEIYNKAWDAAEKAGNLKAIGGYDSAIKQFQSIAGWRDTDEKIRFCEKKIEEIRMAEAAAERMAARKAKKKKITLAVVFALLILAAVAATVYIKVILPKQKQEQASQYLKAGKYDEAYQLLEELGDTETIKQSKADRAKALLAAKDYESAYKLLEEIGDGDTVKQNKADRAEELLAAKDYDAAYALLQEIGDTETIKQSKASRAQELMATKDYEAACALLQEIGDSITIKQCKADWAKDLLEAKDYEAAYTLLYQIDDTETIKQSKYDRAIALLDSGDYEQAYVLLDRLNYKDSEDKVQRILLLRAQVGDYIAFGAYEQDNNTSNGKEDIKWLVLDKDGDRMLVISDRGLDCQEYNTAHEEVTWKTCSLRTWLNKDFINSAFNSDERSMIQITTITTDYASPENNTTDKIFLLSNEEVDKYLPDGSGFPPRLCGATSYAKAQGARDWDDTIKLGSIAWWLRQSYDTSKISAPVVKYNGDFSTVQVDYPYYLVRPAMWIDLGFN